MREAGSSRAISLATFDGRLLDGLEFCRRVYDLFDHIQKLPDGISRMRRRQGLEKKLCEELIPIARYVQARYREGRRLKVRWFSGSQPYDAELWSSGGLVKHRCAPRRVLLEVTCSMHDNEYLARRLLETQGGSFGVKGISRNRKTGVVTSKPSGHNNNEIEIDLAAQILARIGEKAAKHYPWNTILIIQCYCNTLTLLSEWKHAIQRVKDARPAIPFREVFLVENVNSYTETMYGDRPTRKRKTA
jgi:hypothetical protein